MNVQEVIDLAKYSEISGVGIKNNTDAIIAFLNMGLVELYTRFPIKTEEHIITMQAGVTFYEMPADFMYAVSAFGEVPETASVTRVVDLPINDESDPLSIFFPDWNTAQIPVVTDGSFISIIYVAKPAKMTSGDLAAEVPIPDTLVDALVTYIGYRAHVGITGRDQVEDNDHWIRFEAACRKARELGVAFPIDSLNMKDRLASRGFV